MRLLAVDHPDAVDVVVAALHAGGAVVLPTDTVYGLAALPAHQAILLELKGRPASVPIAVLVTGVEQAVAATARPLPLLAERLAARFWPGPLTMVLATGSETLGVRCPDHAFVRAVAEAAGPLATTSANRHGSPTPPDAAAAAASLTGEVAVVIDGGPLDATASTVVDVTGTDPVVLREGPIGSEAIAVAVR